MRKLTTLIFILSITLFSNNLVAQCPTETSVEIKSQEQLEAYLLDFPDCEILEVHALRILTGLADAGTPVHDLSPLSQLREIKGQFSITEPFTTTSDPNDAKLTSFAGLENLQEVTFLSLDNLTNITSLEGIQALRELAALDIKNCNQLEEIRFDNLRMFTPGMNLQSNEKLKRIEGVQVMGDFLYDLTIVNNPLLEVGDIFENIDRVDRLSLFHHDISFVSNFKQIMTLSVTGNEFVTDLSDFTGLVSLTNDLYLSGLADLKDFKIFSDNVIPPLGLNIIHFFDLPNLEELTSLNVRTDARSVTLDVCPSLSDFEPLLKVEKLNFLMLRQLSQIEDLSFLSNVKEIVQLSLVENENLKSLEGLESLTLVEQTFNLLGNPSLIDLDALYGLKSIGNGTALSKFHIRNHPALESILGCKNAFGNFKSLSITDNPKVTTCHIQLVCNHMLNQVSFNTKIENNGVGCNSADEIEEQCYEPITQKIFFDRNENGQDEGEIGLQIGEVLYNQAYTLYPDTKGVINLSPFEGSINLDYEEEAYWEISTGASIALPLAGEKYDTLKTGIFALEEHNNLQVYLTFTEAICDRPYRLDLIVHNAGTTVLSVDAELNGIGSFSWASEDPLTIDGSKISYSINGLFPGQTKIINTSYISPNIADVALGSLLNHVVSFDVYDESDLYLYSDIKEYWLPLLCAYDPNDKQVFPKGQGVDRHTLKDQELQYQIRFQNTGNFPAEDVILIDTLDQDLDLNSFHFVSSSHEPIEIIRQRNIFTFRFENIFLADSISNEPESHGYVSYTIKPKPGLAENTVIENTAYIYFDSNPPIVTNTTKNTLVSQLSTSKDLKENDFEVRVSPNPFAERIALEVDKDLIGKNWKLQTLSGREIISGVVAELKFDLALPSIGSGIYLLSIGSYSEKLIKI